NPEPEDEGMTFWEHLEELRSRLLKIAAAAALGATCAWCYRETILLWLVTPFRDAWIDLDLANEPQLNFPDPAGLYVAYLKLSITAGLVLSPPIILYQIWTFVAPGLYSREKRFAIPFATASTLLF